MKITRASSIRLQETPAFRQDVERTLNAMNDIAKPLVDFLIDFCAECYFGDTAIFDKRSLNVDPSQLDDVNSFLGAVVGGESNGYPEATHYARFLIRSGPNWDKDWKNGDCRNLQTDKWPDWKLAGQRLLKSGVFPIADLGDTFPDRKAHSYVKSICHSVLGSVRSLREVLLSWQKDYKLLSEDAEAKEASLSELPAEKLDRVRQLVSVHDVKLNDRLIGYLKKKTRRKIPEYYVEFFKAICSEDLSDILQELQKADKARYLFERKTVPSPRLPGHDVPIGLHLGHNYVRTKITVADSEGGPVFRFTIPLLGPNGELVEHQVNAFASGYFRDLVVESAGQNVKAAYRKNTKPRTVEAFLKEQDLVINRKGHVTIRVAATSDTLVDLQQRSKISRWLVGGEKKADIPDGFTAMSVDLGISPLFAWEVASVGSDDGRYRLLDGRTAAKVASGRYRTSRFDEQKKQIKAFSEQVNRHRILINHWKALADTPKRIPKRTLKECSLPEDISKKDLEQVLISQRKVLYRDFRALKDQRIGESGPYLVRFSWLNAVEAFIRVLKKWATRNKPPAERGTQYSGTFFKSYTDYKRNLRIDFTRKLASEVVEVAIKHNADVVICERLGHFRPDQQRTNTDNEFLAKWAHADLRTRIREYAENAQIAYVEIDPRHTSQLDPLTGEFGYRDRKYKANLYVNRDNSVVRIDADAEAAVGNLQRRFWNRNSELFYIEVQETESGTFVPVKDPSTQFKRAAKMTLGTATPVFVESGDVFTVTSKRNQKPKNRGKRLKLYRHFGQWVSRDRHWKLQQTLVSASGEENCTENT